MLQAIYYLSHNKKKKSMPQVLTANIPYKLTKATQGGGNPHPGPLEEGAMLAL